MATSTKKILSNLLQEITSKQNWYSKVFNEAIVLHWKQEFMEQAKTSESSNLFDLMISFARATAQGCVHKEDCSWGDFEPLCDRCKEEKQSKIAKDPKKYGFNPADVPGIFEDDDWISELDLSCKHPRCSCISPDFELHQYIEYSQNGLLPEVLRKQLKETITEMLDKEPVDWHPGSNTQVRDLVHPSMYCYVKGVSKVNGKVEPECEEEVRYQWLPSEFEISNGKVKIVSYINNLDHDKYPKMNLLEKCFECFLPSLSKVLKMSLQNSKLQVITKIGQIILTPDNPKYPGGSWHIEGMPHEHIAASCIHYLDVEGITESFLDYRKPVLINEENINYPQSDGNYTTHHYGIEQDSHHEGIMNRYLGAIKCNEGASVVFPNTLQHKVKPFELAKDAKVSRRTIIVFFVIDPKKRIISTEQVTPQQTIFTRKEAEHYRERLMFHRKYFVSMLNKKVFERPYSLCEH
jgi:hypothetical protein